MKLVKKPVNRNIKNKQQHAKYNKRNKPGTASRKMTNAERVLWEDMNQIDWFPIDPYAD